MTEEDIFWLAAKASYSYKDLYGTFPLRIGVHPYWRDLRWMDIRFPAESKHVYTTRPVSESTTTTTDSENVHIVPFIIYLYPEVQVDQVWLYHPDATDWMPSERIFTLAGVPPEERERSPVQGAD